MDVDKSLTEKVVAYLEQLGLNGEQALIYMHLLRTGSQSVLSLSRGLKTGRTKLYPLLEDLASKQLIAVHERHYGTTYEAQPPEVLEFLISEREQTVQTLRGNLKSITHALGELRVHSPATSKIIEYRGIDGIKQMNFNLTKAQSEFRVLELKSLSEHLGNHFTEKLRQTWAERGISSFDLTNNPHWSLKTKVEQYKQLSKARYIDSAVFTIEFETYIYNNCVALLSYEDDDIFGVEIYNDKLARQQIQLFDLLWSQSKPLS